jgi:RNA polymerase sigma-70 factor (ECF subfamily)
MRHPTSRRWCGELRHDIDALPEDERTALLLRARDGLTYEQIAQSMSCPIPTVQRLLVAARIRLAWAGQARQAA